jgi:hypothetical protein
MKTKFVAACGAAAMLASAAMLSDAGGQTASDNKEGVDAALAALGCGGATLLACSFPENCAFDGSPPPSRDFVDHKGDAPDFWCCYTVRSGSEVMAEFVRYYPDGKPRTALDRDPQTNMPAPCTTVLPP